MSVCLMWHNLDLAQVMMADTRFDASSEVNLTSTFTRSGCGMCMCFRMLLPGCQSKLVTPLAHSCSQPSLCNPNPCPSANGWW